jgi:MFS family permease
VADIRTLIGVILLACAAVIAWIGLAINGYQEDAGSTPVSSLWWAIPWTAATAALAVLVLGSIVDRTRRGRWSWLALGLALAMAIVLVALVA